MRNRNKKRFGIILLDKNSGYLYVVRRINYALYDRLNNINLGDKMASFKMLFAMYPNVEKLLEFPKGAKEKKETDFECASREMYEETGIRISKEKVEILAEIKQHHVSDNGKKYLIKYYVVNDEIKTPNCTVVRDISNATVLSDNFNVLLLTKWSNVRDYFVSKKMFEITTTLDRIILNQGSEKTD